ncbi:MAG: autotransporter assembly complex family protein [Pseudomonadota bacterium]
MVRVIGGGDSLSTLLERASITSQAKADADAENDRVEPAEAVASAQGEYRQMTGALYSEGYYGGTVSVRVDGREAADLSLVNPPERVSQVVIDIRPGPRFRFSRAAIAPRAPDTFLPDGYAAGETARSGLIQEAVTGQIEGWRNAGHAKVVLSQERITANHANNTLDSDLRVNPGPRLTFGPLIVTGNNRVRTERIVAIAGLPTGEVYNPEELDDAAARLRRTGAFRGVTLKDAEEIGPGDTLPIVAEIAEEKRRRLGAGVEFSTTEGIGVTSFWMHRNLFGGAENLRFDLDILNIAAPEDDNGIDYFFTAVLRRPATPVTDVDTFFVFSASREEEPAFTSTTYGLGGGVEWFVSNELTLSAGILFQYQDIEDAFGERETESLLFPLAATYDTRDDEFDATRGFFFSAEVTPFVGFRDSASGTHVLLDGRTYYGFGEERNVVLAGRAQIGSLTGPNISEAPTDFLFFAGGGGSVRGQPFQVLGAGEEDGDIFGGRSYLALSGEVRAYVRGPLGVVGFYDAGYVGAEELYDGSGEWISGAGIGLRYDTGFGPIRVDVGTPVIEADDTDPDPVQIYIGIGQAF